MAATEIVHAKLDVVQAGSAPELSVCEISIADPYVEHKCSYCQRKGLFPYTLFYVRDSEIALPKLITVLSCPGCIKKAFKLWNQLVEFLPDVIDGETAKQYFERRFTELGIPIEA